MSSSFPWILVSANDATDREKAQTDSAYQCDGVADDVQIQAALDVLPTGVVYLSSGTFNLAAAPTITTGNALRGVSKWLTFVKQTASTNLARLIDARGKSNLYFSDFTLDGNYANQTVWGYGLDISNNGTTPTNILMERIRFRNIGGAGIVEDVALYRAVHGTGSSPYVRRVRAVDCDVEDCAEGIILAGDDVHASGIFVYKVSRADAGLSGVFVTSGAGQSITHCNIRDTTISCIDFGEMTRGVIADNQFYPAYGGLGMQADGILRDVAIVNNVIEHPATQSGADEGAGILFTGGVFDTLTDLGTRTVLVSHNTIRNSSIAIYIYGANSDVVIADNLIEGWENTAIRVRQHYTAFDADGAPQRITIRGNYLNYTLTSYGVGAAYGIALWSTVGCKVYDNIIRSAANMAQFIEEKEDDAYADRVTPATNRYERNDVTGATATTPFSSVVASSVVKANPGYATENSGATSVADGGTIAHGLVATPTKVRCTPSVSGEFVSVTALAATTFTVAIKTHAGAAGTTQTIYWSAEL